MVIYAKTDGEVVYKYLQSFVTDEQIAAAPSYYDKKYGEGGFNRILESYTSNGGIDNNTELENRNFFDRYADAIMATLNEVRTAVQNNKFDDDFYASIAHVLVPIRVGSRKTLSRVVELIKHEYQVEVHYEGLVDSIGGNTTKKE